MLRLRDQPDLEWLSPKELFQAYLDLLTLDDGSTVREELDQIREGELRQREVLGSTRQTAEDVAMYQEVVREWDAARQNILSKTEEIFRQSGVEGRWIAYGRRSPFHDEEPIPPRFWSFLNFDRHAKTAINERHGLEFAGIRCLILQDIPKRLQTLALLEIADAEAKARMAAEKPQEPTEETGRVTPDCYGEPGLYSRVMTEYEFLGDEVRRLEAERGGKKRLAKIIAERIPGSKVESVERNLRVIRKHQGPNS